MNRLLIELQHLPGIARSSHPDYGDALNRTWGWVIRNICQISHQLTPPIQDSLAKWINGYLKWRIKDLRAPDNRAPISLDEPLSNDKEGQTLLDIQSSTDSNAPTLSGLDRHIQQLQKQKVLRVGVELERYIERDPEGKLRICYPHGYPQCNCQTLSKRRYLQDPPDTFKAIALDLNVPQSQVTNHWYGKCQTLLQKIAKKLGYQPEKQP